MRRWVSLRNCRALWMLLILSVAATSARAASSQVSPAFSIPAQSLSSALIAFGKQANVQVLTAGNTTALFRSTAVNGAMTADKALAGLLQGTGLSFAFIDAETVVIKPPPTVATTDTKAPPSPSVANAKLLSPVHSIGQIEMDTGYMADDTSGATRMNSDLIDVPQSVSVVTRDLMDSQQIRTVADAVRNVPGVQYVDGSDGLPVFQIRGFSTGNGMTDSMPNSFAGSGDFPPLIGVERVEVLKGPESILGDSSSNSDFGGLINIVMKKPQSEPVHELSYSVGQYGDKQLGLDLAGPLAGSSAWTYRLVLSSEYADRTAQGYHGQRTNYLAPSIGWHSDKSKLVVGVERIVNRLPIPDHTILLDDTLASSSPPGILLGNPRDHSTYQTSRLYYLFEHKFNDVWTFRSRGQYVRQHTSEQDWTFENPTPTGDVDAIAEVFRYNDAYYTLQNDIAATFGQGLLRHTVVVGFDYARTQLGSLDDFLNFGATSYNIFSGAPLPPAGSAPGGYQDLHQGGSPWSTDSGLFLQDQIAIGQSWDVLLALRRSAYELSTYDFNGNPLNLQKSQWVPNAGIVYKVTANAALYASTASGFQPDTNLGKNGRPLIPVLSRQIEAGSKFDLFDDRARLTASWYRIMVDRSYDLSSPKPPYFTLPGPGQTNKGVEIEFTGRVAPGMDVTASYTRASIQNHDGTQAIGAPRQRFTLWSSYWFQGGALQGWGVAAGAIARSHSVGETFDETTYFNIPGQASVDANVSYRAKMWSVTLGVKNIFDRNLYSDYFDETFVPLHNRRTILMTGSYAF